MAHKLSFLLVSLVFTVACGDSGGSGGSDGGGGGNGVPSVTVMGDVIVTGSAVAAGTFTRPSFSTQPSCEIWASEGAGGQDQDPAGTFRVPAPFLGEPLEPSGEVYNSTVRIEFDYAGPGTYVNDGEVTQIFGKIVIGNLNSSPQYFPEDGIATVTVNADGSGTFVFEDIPEVVEGFLTISGTVVWTCTATGPPAPAE
jgi:hypothetical protein